MKRQMGLLAVFTFGLLAGAAIPFAGAHPESECPTCPVCEVCQACPQDDGGDEDGAPDEEGHPQHVDKKDEEAIRKALEAIEKAEGDSRVKQLPDAQEELE